MNMPAPHGKLSRKLWLLLLLAALIILAVYLQLPAKSYFVFDNEPAFYAVMGFMAPFFLVVITRIAGYKLKQRKDYWINPSQKIKGNEE
jgi:hypothetical protein